MTTLYRAADSDYIQQGTCFAAEREAAEAYLANPGYGGATIWTTDAHGSVLDLRGMSTSEVASLLGLPDPGSIGIDEWLPSLPSTLSAARATGALWAMVDESYPEETTTWIWLGTSDDDEPELTVYAA
jgi:hypothetical protein